MTNQEAQDFLKSHVTIIHIGDKPQAPTFWAGPDGVYLDPPTEEAPSRPDPFKDHRAYYGQMVTASLKRTVVASIGRAELLASTDPYFNDIPLRRWDNLVSLSIFGQTVAAQHKKDRYTGGVSLSQRVCLAKEAARQWVESEKQNPPPLSEAWDGTDLTASVPTVPALNHADLDRLFEKTDPDTLVDLTGGYGQGWLVGSGHFMDLHLVFNGEDYDLYEDGRLYGNGMTLDQALVHVGSWQSRHL